MELSAASACSGFVCSKCGGCKGESDADLLCGARDAKIISCAESSAIPRVRPLTYREPMRFETMPSRPNRRQARCGQERRLWSMLRRTKISVTLYELRAAAAAENC
jgi:hypothetical protein